MTGSLDRDLETDISIIKSSSSSALATLMEELELNYYGVPKAHLEAITKSHGLDWFFLPIKDADIPALSFCAMNSGHCFRTPIVIHNVNFSHSLFSFFITLALTGRQISERSATVRRSFL